MIIIEKTVILKVEIKKLTAMKKILFFLGIAILSFGAKAQDSAVVTFNVDMRQAILDSTFNPATDTLFVTGSFLGWADPGTDYDNQLMTDEDNDSVYTRQSVVPVGEIQYKYFKNSGWAQGEWNGDPNRVVQVSGDTTLNDVWAVLTPEAVKPLQSVKVSVAPNPVVNILKVSADKNYNIAVYDINGKLINTLQMRNNTSEIDFSALPVGTYIVRVYNETETGVYKVVKR